MLIETLFSLLLALLAGILAGTFTGLAPAIHINLVSLGLVTVSPFLLNFFSPLILAVFIVAMSITHTFIDFIPSVFLGAPDEDTALSVLPGHRLLLKGRGYEAVILTAYGSALGILAIIILSPLFVLFLPFAYNYIKAAIPFILIITSLFLVLSEKKNRLLALVIFLLSGFFGLVTLNLQIKEPLLPLLSGLFGTSSLITSIIKKQRLPEQKVCALKKIKIMPKKILKVFFSSLAASPLCSFLPGLGSSQAALIGSEISRKRMEEKSFLMLLGSVNTIVMGMSFVTLYTIQKSRTGSAVAISKLLENFSLSSLAVIILTAAITGALAFFLTVFIAKKFSPVITKIDYSRLSIVVLLFITAVVIFFSGWLGLILLIVSTATGLTAILLGVRRTHLMGCLLVSSIVLSLI